MLSRSNTWPVVVVRLNDGRTSSQLEPLQAPKEEAAVPATKVSRKATTLYRHYYLEGGWGWAVVVASVVVHMLSHGVQLSWGVLLEPTSRKFTASINDTG